MRRMSFLFLFLSLTPRIAQAQDMAMKPPDCQQDIGKKTILAHADNQHTGGITRGNRWIYHPEYRGHYQDFIGRTGSPHLDDYFGASKDPDGYSLRDNCWRAQKNFHSAGFLCRDLVPQNLDAEKLHVRVKLRLPVAPLDTGIQALQVYVLCGRDTVINYIITGEETKRTDRKDVAVAPLAADKYYGEVYVGSFNKVGNQSVDVQLYWFGTVTVHVDYIAVDNAEAEL